jgi:squalene-associated FAD-dependent desaturase
VTLSRAESAADHDRTVVVGAGLAGLAAALKLAEAGRAVTLLESRRQLGGRASSFLDPSTQELVDNCQHVSMGCCTNLADFCERVGISDQIEIHRILYFLDEQGHVSRMSAAPLPAPLHLAPSFLFLRFLRLGQKIQVARGMIALLARSADTPGESFLAWLRAKGQQDDTIERFWGLVLTSALNESIDRIDLHYARQVFVEGFLARGRAFRVEIPRTPLSEFYGPVLEASLRSRGVDLRTQTNVARVVFENARVAGVSLRTGETILAKNVILAVAPHHVASLIPEENRRQDDRFEGIERLESSPITSVHLWYDRPVMTYPHLVVVGRQVQWLFRRPAGNEGYVQAVISASRDLSARGAEEVLSIVRAETEELLPLARSATLKHHRVVTERRATFSVLPGVDRDRPSSDSSTAGLVLAGDYVQTGWPATMEGAVRGGYIAAGSVLGLSPAQSLIPSLQAEPTVRLLAWLAEYIFPTRKGTLG